MRTGGPGSSSANQARVVPSSSRTVYSWASKRPPSTSTTSGAMVRQANREARAGRAMPFGVVVDEELVGQLTVGAIALSSLRSCTIGYWIDQGHAGRGLMTRAVALVGDYCFLQLRLHRIEINIRPENTASLAVVHKLGFRKEGTRERYLHIDGGWRDHWSFALTAEERPDGLRSWLRGQGRSDGASVSAAGD